MVAHGVCPYQGSSRQGRPESGAADILRFLSLCHMGPPKAQVRTLPRFVRLEIAHRPLFAATMHIVNTATLDRF
jgi:hypothetical protein